jgi:N-acetylglucosamine-6-phosphate deacetylase
VHHREQRLQVGRLGRGARAGQVLDRVFSTLVVSAGLSLVEAAQICSTTPARELGLTGQGVIGAGSLADLAVLTPDLRVTQTWVGGRTSGHEQP